MFPEIGKVLVRYLVKSESGCGGRVSACYTADPGSIPDLGLMEFFSLFVVRKSRKVSGPAIKVSMQSGFWLTVS